MNEIKAAIDNWEAKDGREIHVGQCVEVYRNLHKGGWSVRHAKTKRVLGHCTNIVLESPEFIVSEAGRQRVLRDKRKNVHAFVRGYVVAQGATDGMTSALTQQLTYNPYENDSFVRVGTQERVTYAPYVFMLMGELVFTADLRGVTE